MRESVWRAAGLFLAAFAASLLFYWPALNAFFLNDELSLIAHVHPHLEQGWGDCFRLMTNGFWRPVNLLVARVHIVLFGLAPLAWHITCLIIHAAAAMLTGLLAGRLFRGAVWAPVTACLLMATMPAAWGPATLLNQTNDSLLACCILGALLLWDSWLARPRRGVLLALGLVILFSITVKETSVVIVALLALWAIGAGRVEKRSITVIGVTGLFYAAYTVLIYYVQSHLTSTYSGQGRLITKAAPVFANWIRYVYSAFVPFPYLHQSDDATLILKPLLVTRIKAALIYVMIGFGLALASRGQIRRFAAVGLMIAVVLFPPSLLAVEFRGWYLYAALPMVCCLMVAMIHAAPRWGRFAAAGLVCGWWIVMISWFYDGPTMWDYVERADYHRRFAAAESPHTHDWKRNDVITILGAPDMNLSTDTRWVYIQLLHKIHNYGGAEYIAFDAKVKGTTRMYWFDGAGLVEIPPQEWIRFFTIWKAHVRSR